ncbi:uncharacterized protein LOC129289342 isoform X2 [Prosopis cineraria]|uniref:uncharacterized protein LOC129289342 isoform X2 n=1 Tax=Prosopis cineraria TaxID=364024 RepID=UPI0024103EF0|nr:uncharacterized protein LOC129289342 isoform X2 [Prosopis cineraria]
MLCHISMALSVHGFHSFSQTIFPLFLLYCSFCVGLHDEFSILNSDINSLYRDYTPPSPPPPPPLPDPPSLLCQEDLKGIGSLDAFCELNTSLIFYSDVYIEGNGSLHILSNVSLTCPVLGCLILINILGEFSLHSHASIIAGTVFVKSQNLSLLSGSLINVTGLAGAPPEQTSGTPSGTQGAGGGHGGRGASCVTVSTKLPDDVWGGDAYSWSSLDRPWSYGSKGGTTSKEETYGGEGGGRILLNITGSIEVSGDLLANGGDGGIQGGGGSGGSIYIKARMMTGSGKISATGGNGFAGGGGGRVSIDAFRSHDNTKFFIHGGRSLGCSGNSGAAGTFYDAVLQSLVICNHNLSTHTDTLLLEFPKLPLWRNVYVQNQAKALVPLYWSRVQVGGVIRLTSSAVLSFGLAHFGSSEFELMAEELLMSDSMIKVYGALRMSVKIHLMLSSNILINGAGDSIVATSLLEASNLMVLKESSVIHSNANLGVHGQGLLNLSGPGNLIEAQHLILSLFYSVNVGPGSVLRGPLDAARENSGTPQLYCELANCPMELLHPPEDCNVNSTLAFTLQFCRVEDVIVQGTINGSVVHFHWIRNVDVHSSGVITVSGLGCAGGLGRGRYYENGLGGGGGHGGNGGDGYYNGNFIEGGTTYGNADLPCELGSGSGNSSLAGATAGGGIIVMGSLEHSLSSLILKGSLRADGESFGEDIRGNNGRLISSIGPGGGSGGTILLFVRSLVLGDSSMISTAGGHGSPSGGGGGGGGRVHFHWTDILVGDEYIPLASVKGTIHARGGFGGGRGLPGKNGTISGRDCPKGLFGIFCEECPVGTFKNVSGSDGALCHNCPPYELPHRAIYVSVRGGVTEIPCPYKCISDRYHMPNCYTTFEELVHTFGGPWLFGLVLLGLPVLFALVLSIARMKYVGGDDLPALDPSPHDTRINSFPFLESLNEIMETNRNEESQNHVHRLYFQGPNTFSEPWHLSHCPPEQVKDIVYEDAFNRFVDEINVLATYHWWEGSMYKSEIFRIIVMVITGVVTYIGFQVAATSDLMLAYMDFFLGGDEKRPDLPPRLRQRLPVSIIFGGDGSYMAPFSIHNDNILSSIMSQSVPPTTWYRLVAGLNAQLRLVCRGHLRLNLEHVVNWFNLFANPALRMYGVRVDLAWFQPTASGYCQFGLVVRTTENECTSLLSECHDEESLTEENSCFLPSHCNPEHQLMGDKHLVMPRRISGEILHTKSIRTLKEKKSIYYPFSFILYNTKPIGHQDLVGLLISILLLADLILILLTLIQTYSLSLLNFFLVLFVLPFGVLFPFPSGINALFSQGPRRSAGLARLYALWNLTSLVNVVVAFICGFIHCYTAHSNNKQSNFQSWSFSMDEREWWVLPSGLALSKIIQARLIDCHVANQEIKDLSLYSADPNVFWQS